MRRSGGFSLIEVMLASLLLGVGLMVLMQGVSVSLRGIRVAKRVQDAQLVLGRGELEYPLVVGEEKDFDPVADIEVDEDSSFLEGYSFSRVVEDDDDEDGLYLVRTIVKWGEAPESREEVLQYIFKKPDESSTKGPVTDLP